MRLRELIEQLQEAADVYGDTLDVHVATQPGHPLAYHLSHLSTPYPDGGTPAVWLVLGGPTDDPYAVPEEVWAR